MIDERGCPMKSPRVLIALSVLLLTVGWVIWDRVHTFSPTAETTFSATPETESAFLKNYTPTNVMNRLNEGQGRPEAAEPLQQGTTPSRIQQGLTEILLSVQKSLCP
jgi:hypothetical protein